MWILYHHGNKRESSAEAFTDDVDDVDDDNIARSQICVQ